VTSPADTIREALKIIRRHHFNLLVVGAIRIFVGRDAANSAANRYLDKKKP
jgi:hypothetical protein